MLDFHRQAIATSQTTAHHTARQSRHHRRALGGRQILSGMQPPDAEQWMETPAKAAAGGRLTDDRQQQAPVAIARKRCGPRCHPEDAVEIEAATVTRQQRRDGHRERGQGHAIGTEPVASPDP